MRSSGRDSALRQPPRALLLDLDDTILDFSGNIEEYWERACMAFERQLGGVEPAVLLAAIHRTRGWYWSDPDRHRVGRLDLEAARADVVRLSLADLGVDDAELAAKIAGEYGRARDAGMRLFPGAVETVAWLRNSGHGLALLTNGNAAMQRAKVMRFGLERFFDAVLIEGEVGFGKPDPRIYELALRQLGVEATDAWMVGDILAWDVTPAQKLGMTGVWIDLEGAGVPDGVQPAPHHVIRRLADIRDLIDDASDHGNRGSE